MGNLARATLNAYFKSRKPPGPLDARVGDEVGYTRYFLKQIGVPGTDPMWRQRGLIVGLHLNGRWALVHWYDEDKPRLVALTNLAIPGCNRRHNE